MLKDSHEAFFYGTVDGLLMLALGVMILVATIKGGTMPMTPVWLWITTATGFAVAVFLIIEGVVLLLTP